MASWPAPASQLPLDEPGVPESFEAFYRREFRSVVGLAFVLCGNRWAAEEIAQDAFLAAHRSWEKVASYDQPGAWVRRVVSNLATSAVRRRVREARAMIRLAARPTIGPVDDDSAAFWDAVRTLPRRQAQAVALHYLEDRPVAEIARILGCAEGTVKVQLHRGRKTLASRLGLDAEGA